MGESLVSWRQAIGMECLWRKKESSEWEERRPLQLNWRMHGEDGGGGGTGVGGGGGGEWSGEGEREWFGVGGREESGVGVGEGRRGRGEGRRGDREGVSGVEIVG